MAWQRVGCSHDGGSNVLGQTPVDYSATSPRGRGQGGMRGLDSEDAGALTNFGGSGATPRGGGEGGRTPRAGGLYGKPKPRDQASNGQQSSGGGGGRSGLPDRSIEECVEEIMETMSKRKTRNSSVGGLKALRQKFILFDDSDNTRSETGQSLLNWEEFYTGMKAQQNFRPIENQLTESEIRALFNYCDVDKSNYLSMSEFLGLVIDLSLPEVCKKEVDDAWDVMDADGQGDIDISDLKGRYKVSQHPDVLNGKLTENEAFAAFISKFEPEFLSSDRTKRNVSDSRITKEEWLDYHLGIYREYRASYGNPAANNVFITMMKKSYKPVTYKVQKEHFTV